MPAPASSPFFILFLCLSLLIPPALSQCPLSCSKQGTCNTYGQCECQNGFQGAACEERTCPFARAWSDFATADDEAHAEVECSARGLCDRESGACVCMEGFVGKACQRTACLNNCNGRGRCVSLQEKASSTRNEDSVQFVYEDVWDAEKVYGCLCDDGFSGYDCSLFDCPDGDDPMTTGQVNEKQLIKCTANNDGTQGTFALYYEGRVSATIDAGANAATLKAALETISGLGEVTVTYSDGLLQACQTSVVNVIQVEFTTAFGSLKPLVAYTDDLYPEGSSITIAADGASTMTSSVGDVYYSVKGTKEALACAGRGTCDTTTGSCSCYVDNGDTFASSDSNGNAGTRGDCGYAASTISACPGETPCSGNGVCDSTGGTYKCSCSDGWTGGNCNERICPSGGSWFEYPQANNAAHKVQAECSDKGICDRSAGTCECASGFFGEACQYMACGGGTAFPCSGHGTCLSMRHLSWESDNDGDATDFVYGTDPNNFFTWDADRVFGCMCDPDWHGYDCSLRKCPYGDNPSTYNDAREVQLLTCEATAGTFRLQFRQEYTEELDFNIEIGALKTALEALDTINVVEIDYSIDKITYSTNSSYYPVYQCGSEAAGSICLTDALGTQQATSTGLTVAECQEACDNNVNCKSFTFGSATGTCNLYDLATNSTSKSTVSATTQSYYFTEVPTEVKGINRKGFCTNSSTTNVVSVTFNNPSGNVPAIVVYSNSLTTTDLSNQAATGVITIATDGDILEGFTSVKGTTDREYCSGRGSCNTELGSCTCYTGWGSSDGHGGMGALNDCGFRQDPIGGLTEGE